MITKYVESELATGVPFVHFDGLEENIKHRVD